MGYDIKQNTQSHRDTIGMLFLGFFLKVLLPSRSLVSDCPIITTTRHLTKEEEEKNRIFMKTFTERTDSYHENV